MAGRKRRDEWGSITEVVPRKKYRIRYWATDKSGIYRRMTKTVRGTRREAEKVRAELMIEHGDERPHVTVNYVWENWFLPSLERKVEDGDLSDKTLSVRKSQWENTVKPRWGVASCDGIRPLDIQKWIDTLGYSKANQCLNLLRPMLDFAVRYDDISSNPFRERYVLPSRSKVVQTDKGVWTLGDMTIVWDAVRDKWFEGAFICAAFGGCRVGESLGVMSNDIEVFEMYDMPVAVVRIDRQVLNKGGVTDRLKNRQSRRDIVIVGRPAERLWHLSEINGPWVSGDGLGGHSSQLRLSTSWKRVSESLPEGMWHPYRNLRNSYQTYMRWEVGLDQRYIEQLLGHEGSSITDKHYDRPDRDTIVGVVAREWASYFDRVGREGYV